MSRATEPIDIALLVDNSTAASDEITFFREALSTFVAAMAPGNRIALVGLADRPTILVDYTDDAERLTDAVGRIFAMPRSGMTLLDGIVETSQGLDRRETPRAVIVPVITDGAEFTNRYSQRRRRRAEKSSVGAAPRHDRPVLPTREEHGIRERSFLLDEGPRATGGQRITLLAPHGARPARSRSSPRELSSQYKVVYSRPESLDPA